MNPLTQLITSLRHELNLAPHSLQNAPLLQDLEALIMEGAVATFLESESQASTEEFLLWIEAHQDDAVLLTKVLEKFPALMTAVHSEMVIAIDQAKNMSLEK